MELAGLYKLADHILVNAVLILPLSKKTTSKGGGGFNHVVLNSTIVINMGVEHEGEKMGDFNI
jgi:hypothetical protein